MPRTVIRQCSSLPGVTSDRRQTVTASVTRPVRTKRDDDAMKFGFVVPWADAAEIGELAAVAELHGWDGLFVWEPVWGVDAWVALAVAACRTKKLRLGTMLTPLPRRKPWELAGQVATVDRLSNGRVIVSVGLGAPDSGYEAFGEETDKVVRGELLDEGLDILRGLWAGQPFKPPRQALHDRAQRVPDHRSHDPEARRADLVRRRARFEQVDDPGALVRRLDSSGRREWAALANARSRSCRTLELPDRRFDVIVEGAWSEHSPAAWAKAGATWWLETLWSAVSDPDVLDCSMSRLRQGPPARCATEAVGSAGPTIAVDNVQVRRRGRFDRCVAASVDGTARNQIRNTLMICGR